MTTISRAARTTPSKVFPRNNSFSFLNNDQAVSRDVLKYLLRTAQPVYGDASCLAGATQAKVQSQIALRAKAPATAYFLNLLAAIRFDDYSRSDGRAIGPCSHQFYEQPRIGRRSL